MASIQRRYFRFSKFNRAYGLPSATGNWTIDYSSSRYYRPTRYYRFSATSLFYSADTLYSKVCFRDGPAISLYHWLSCQFATRIIHFACKVSIAATRPHRLMASTMPPRPTAPSRSMTWRTAHLFSRWPPRCRRQTFTALRAGAWTDPPSSRRRMTLASATLGSPPTSGLMPTALRQLLSTMRDTSAL